MTTSERSRSSIRAADQLLNSASSAAFALCSVLILPVEAFGVLTLQLLAMALVIGLLRAGVFEAALFSRGGPVSPRQFASLVFRAGSMGAAVAGLLMTFIGLVLPGQSASVAIAVGFIGVGSVLADGARYEAIAYDRSKDALVADSIWLAGVVGGIVLMYANSAVGFMGLTTVYSVSAVVGGLTAHKRVSSVSRGQPTLPWASLRPQSRFGVEFLLQIMPGLAVVVVAPAVIGLDGLGLYGAVATLFQPLTTAAGALRLGVLGGQSQPDELMRSMRSLIAAMFAFGCAYLVATIAIVHWAPLFDHGALANTNLLLIGLYGVAEICRVSMQPLYDIDRVLGRLARLLRIRSAQAVALVAMSVGLGYVCGVNGYAGARLLSYAGPIPFYAKSDVRGV